MGLFLNKKKNKVTAHDHSPYGGLNLWLSHEHEINQMLFGKVLKKALKRTDPVFFDQNVHSLLGK